MKIFIILSRFNNHNGLINKGKNWVNDDIKKEFVNIKRSTNGYQKPIVGVNMKVKQISTSIKI